MNNVTGLSRRQVLGSGLAAMAGMAMTNGHSAISPKASGVGGVAIGAQLKLACAAYSYRDYLPRNGKPGEMTLFDWLDLAAAWGLDGVEMTSYYFTSEEAKYMIDLKARAFKLGLDICGTSVGNNFCSPDQQERDKQIADVKRWIDHSVILGAPCMRVFAGKKSKDQDTRQDFTRVVESLKVCCDYAGERGVFLALENHGYLTETSAEILAIVNAVNHKWLGINLDTGNFVADPYNNMAQVLSKTLTLHAKTSVRTMDGKDTEPADFPRIMAMLRETNYRGYISLEYEGDEEAKIGVPKCLARLRAAMTV